MESEITHEILVPEPSDSFDERTGIAPIQFEEVLKVNASLLEKNIWISRLQPKKGESQWRIITNTEEQRIPDDGSVESENLLQAAADAIGLPYSIHALDIYCVISVTRITTGKNEWVDLCSIDGPDGRARHYQIKSSQRKEIVPIAALAALYCLAQNKKGYRTHAVELFRHHLPESVKSTCKQFDKKIFLTEELPLGSTISRFHGLEACLREPTVLNLRNVSADWGCRPSVARYTIELSAVLEYLKTLPAHRLENVRIVDLQSTDFHDAGLKYLLEIDALIASSAKPCVFNLSRTLLIGSDCDNEIFMKELSLLLCHNIVLVINTFFAEDVEAGELVLPSDILNNKHLKFSED